MKKAIFLILTIGLFASCQPKGPARYSVNSAEIDVAKKLVADYEKGDWDAWTGHYADSAKVYHNSVDAVTPEQISEGLKDLLKSVSSYGFSDEDVYYEMVIDDQGEKWVNYWANWEGVLEANDKKLTIPVHITLQFVENKIVEEHAYYDMSEYVTSMNEIAAAKMAEEAVEE
ncbi:nuclear transport factor 2 family protein [Spongiimicrobium sp. 3-5]|uniref:nuclear transport factor 2 family protein n=1 Tax=Spongiimicrobium sp. 3-5 TaxID=3332596 RepID=UPI00397F0536